MRTNKSKKTNKRKGTTLIELVVSFALLGIFVAASSVVIANITNLYFHIRAESYARQVGDIITGKIASEINGAMYDDAYTSLNPVIEDDFEGMDVTGNVLTLYNREETGISMFASDGILYIYYMEIKDETDPDSDRKAVLWTFDKTMYNGYTIESLEFVPANDPYNSNLSVKYDAGDTDPNDYPSNIVAVYMKIKSEKYGSYNMCRYMKIYNAPEDMNW